MNQEIAEILIQLKELAEIHVNELEEYRYEFMNLSLYESESSTVEYRIKKQVYAFKYMRDSLTRLINNINKYMHSDSETDRQNMINNHGFEYMNSKVYGDIIGHWNFKEKYPNIYNLIEKRQKDFGLYSQRIDKLNRANNTSSNMPTT